MIKNTIASLLVATTVVGAGITYKNFDVTTAGEALSDQYVAAWINVDNYEKNENALLAKYEALYSSATTRATEDSTKLTNKNTQIKELLETQKSLEGEVATLKATVSEKQGLIDKYLLAIGSLQNDVTSLNKALGEANTNVAKLSEELENKKAEITKINGELAKAQDDLETIKEALAQKESALTTANNTIANLESDLEAANNTNKAYEEALEKANAQIDLANDFVRDINNALKDLNKKADPMDAKYIEGLETKIDVPVVE